MRQISLTIVVAMIVLGLTVLGGCQPWKQKYESCNAELENLQALFDGAQSDLQQCQSEKNKLNQQLQSAVHNLQQAQTHKPGALEKAGGVYDAKRGTITVTLANNVLFDSGKTTLKAASKSRLGQIAAIIQKDYPGKEVWVIGHTDTDPIRKSKWKDNWQLSTERALAVTRYLIQRGISARHLVAAGRGQFHPIGTSKSQNRRVEIVVYTR